MEGMGGMEGRQSGTGLVWGECPRGWFELLRAGQAKWEERSLM